MQKIFKFLIINFGVFEEEKELDNLMGGPSFQLGQS